MELLISILIWMGVMVEGGEYTQAQMDAMVIENQQTIDMVTADPVMQQDVMQYGSETVPTIIIGEGE